MTKAGNQEVFKPSNLCFHVEAESSLVIGVNDCLVHFGIVWYGMVLI